MTDEYDDDVLDFEDDELKIIIKSLSLTYDASSKRLDRLDGRHYADTLAEVEACDRALTKVKAEMVARWHNNTQTGQQT